MGTTTIRDIDRGYAALVARVFDMAKSLPVIKIGVLAGNAEEPHAAPGEATSGEPATVLDVAIFNEFGTDTIPERSFLRGWFDESEKGLRDDAGKMMQSVIHGQRTRDQILELLGQRSVGQIQERIASGIEPDNAPSTIRQKGSSTPLVDTGVLRSSITYEVTEG